MFDDLGLDTDLELLYRLVVTRGTWRVTDLATELGVTEDEIRFQLDRLATLQLLQPSGERPDAVRALRPEVALASIMSSREAELLLRQQELDRARLAVAELAALSTQRGRDGVHETERLVGIDAIRTRMEHLAVSCAVSVLSLMPGGGQTPGSLEASRPLDELALRRGVRMRTVYQDSARRDRPTLDYIRWSTAFGAQSRTAPTLPMRLLVVDEEVAVVDEEVAGVPSDRGHERCAYVLEGRALVAGLVRLFDIVWKEARALPAAGDAEPQELLTPTERTVLDLLARGMTDEGVARRLAVSVRSVRRVTATVMEKLDAQSRFQAGAVAAGRGWITGGEVRSADAVAAVRTLVPRQAEPSLTTP